MDDVAHRTLYAAFAPTRLQRRLSAICVDRSLFRQKDQDPFQIEDARLGGQGEEAARKHGPPNDDGRGNRAGCPTIREEAVGRCVSLRREVIDQQLARNIGASRESVISRCL